MVDCQTLGIWKWFENNNIYFCTERGNRETNNPRQMLECMDFWYVNNNKLYLSLKDSSELPSLGFLDDKNKLGIIFHTVSDFVDVIDISNFENEVVIEDSIMKVCIP